MAIVRLESFIQEGKTGRTTVSLTSNGPTAVIPGAIRLRPLPANASYRDAGFQPYRVSMLLSDLVIQGLCKSTIAAVDGLHVAADA